MKHLKTHAAVVAFAIAAGITSPVIVEAGELNILGKCRKYYRDLMVLQLKENSTEFHQKLNRLLKKYCVEYPEAEKNPSSFRACMYNHLYSRKVKKQTVVHYYDEAEALLNSGRYECSASHFKTKVVDKRTTGELAKALTTALQVCAKSLTTFALDKNGKVIRNKDGSVKTFPAEGAIQRFPFYLKLKHRADKLKEAYLNLGETCPYEKAPRFVCDEYLEEPALRKRMISLERKIKEVC